MLCNSNEGNLLETDDKENKDCGKGFRKGIGVTRKEFSGSIGRSRRGGRQCLRLVIGEKRMSITDKDFNRIKNTCVTNKSSDLPYREQSSLRCHK